MSERDLFADFDRMRREMDELFGGVLERSFGGGRAGFSPRVDVSYAADPPRAIVTAELAGINPDDLELVTVTDDVRKAIDLIVDYQRRVSAPETHPKTLA